MVLWNRGPLKILNGIKLILDDQGNHLDSYTISLELFRSFRGPLFHKPVTGQELFCCFLQQTGSSISSTTSNHKKPTTFGGFWFSLFHFFFQNSYLVTFFPLVFFIHRVDLIFIVLIHP